MCIRDSVDRTDTATAIFKINSDPAYKDNLICYHRSNSLAKAIRGSLVSNCLEIDIVIANNGEIFVDHDKPSGPSLDYILSAVEQKNIYYWLDGKNIDDARKCEVLFDFLTNRGTPLNHYFVEFPSNTNVNDQDIETCISKMTKSGLTVSYYIPTWVGLDCLERADSQSCEDFDKFLDDVSQSKLFTDISFDIRILDLIDKHDQSKFFKLNVWGLEANTRFNIANKRFSRLIFNTHHDPNNR